MVNIAAVTALYFFICVAQLDLIKALKKSCGSRKLILTKIYDTSRYDPYVSDPKLRDLIATQIVDIKEMRMGDVKNELWSRNITLRGYSDRAEIELLLAKARVYQILRCEQISQQEQQSRSDNIFDVEVAKKEILATMDERSIILELRHRGVKFSPLQSTSDLVSILALARLKLLATTNTYEDSSTLSSSYLGAIVANMSSRIVHSATALSNVAESIGRLADTKLLTAAEQKAQNVVNNSEGSIGDPVLNSFESNRACDAESLLVEASSLASFDDIVSWAKQKPIVALHRILLYLGEEIPQKASRSRIAHMVADALLSWKTFSADSDLDDRPSSIEDRPKETSRSHVSSDLMKVYKTDRGEVHRDKPVKTTSLFDDRIKEMLDPERAIFRRTMDKIGDALLLRLPRFVQQRTAILKSGDMKTFFSRAAVRLTSSGFIAGFGEVVQWTAALGLSIVYALGRWAVEDEMWNGSTASTRATGRRVNTSSADIAVFIASLYAAVAKRGVISFLSAILFIRFLRIIFRGKRQQRDEETSSVQL